MKMNHNGRIGDTVIYEAYFDLWGFTVNWIDAICDALHEYCDCDTDTAEAYKCMACMAFRFQSTDKKRTEEAKRIFKRLANLATVAMKGHKSSEIVYVNV